MKYIRNNLPHKKKGDKTFLIEQSKGVIITLNEVGGSIWKYLEKSLSIKQIIKKVTTEYNAKPKEVQVDVENFIKTALKTKLIKKIN